MIFYAIRHIKTQLLMPTFKRGRGYSHWNPSNQKKLAAKDLGYPRLFPTEQRANKVITQWFAMPNAEYRGYTNHHGEDDYDIRDLPDGRKKEDLEVIKIEVRIRK